MPAISRSLVVRDAFGQVLKREENWAKQEVGVVVVFCMVFVIACLVIGIFVHKKLAARKAAKQSTYQG